MGSHVRGDYCCYNVIFELKLVHGITNLLMSFFTHLAIPVLTSTKITHQVNIVILVLEATLQVKGIFW